MARRLIRDEADARACLDQAHESGLPRQAWARREGIDARSLNAWALNFQRRTAPRMVELVPTAPALAPLVVRSGRLEVEVREGFDEATLLRLLRLLAAC